MFRSVAFSFPLVALALAAAAPAQDTPTRPPPLGVTIEPTDAGAGNTGYTVRSVLPDSPAAAAGFRPGDVITGADGKAFTDRDALLTFLGRHKPGDKVSFQVRRDGQEKTLTVTLGGRPAAPRGGGEEEAAPAEEQAGPHIGALAVPADGLTPALKKQLGVSGDKGLVAVDVMAGSPAARAGLRRGDVITRVGDKDVTDFNSLRDALRAAGTGKPVTVHVQRGGEGKDLSITPVAGGAGGPGAWVGPGGAPPEGVFRRPPDLARQLERLERRLQQIEKRLDALEHAKPQPK
jgi:S1-C subfamily serine protease